MDTSVQNISVLIPAYNPDCHLLPLIDGLIDCGFISIIVVNDGSTSECAAVFSEIEGRAACSVLHHAVNLGKGRALKTGMNHFLVNAPDSCGVVTCDADGQHLIEDVVKVAGTLKANPGSLVLGARQLMTDVPLRSKLGNVITRAVFYFLVGKYLSDTQTGLRGIPACFVPLLLRLEGEGYEFEMNMLIATRTEGVSVFEETISTVYIENNRSSHFNPLLDSMKIYFLLLRFSVSSLLASLLDIVLFSICFTLTSSIFFSVFLGRYTIGPLVNFFMNRHFVFHHRHRIRKAFLKYYLFATIMGACAFLLIKVLTDRFHLGVITAKVLVETVLFIISFTVQRDYIFTAQAAAMPLPEKITDRGQ